jgi:hypothetical protein
MFAILSSMLWNVTLIFLCGIMVLVYGIAIFKLFCYIKRERRLKRIESAMDDCKYKIQQIMKESNEHGNLQ